MEKVKIGFIACGRYSSWQLGMQTKWPRSIGEFIAGADPNKKTAENLVKNYGGKAAYEDYREMLKREDITAICINTPPGFRAQPAIDAANAGKHVLCTKPMAISLAECDAMIEAARRNKVILAVSLSSRLSRDGQRAKALVETGKLGKLYMANMQFVAPVDVPETSDEENGLYHHWFERQPWNGYWKTEGGGPTLNFAVHLIDLVQWYMGDAESVFGQMGTFVHNIETEDNSIAAVRYKNGAIGWFASSSSAMIDPKYPHHSCRVELIGTEETIFLNNHVDMVLEYRTKRHVKELEKWLNENVPPPPVPAYGSDLYEFLSAILEGRETTISGEEGRKSIEIIMGIYKSALTDKMVALPIEKCDPFYQRMEKAMEGNPSFPKKLKARKTR